MVYKISRIKDAGVTELLAQLRPNLPTYGFTIAFSPSLVLRIDKQKIRFGDMKPNQQYHYYIIHITRFFTMFDVIVATYEFTKNGMLHCHMICQIDDQPEFGLYHLMTIRGYMKQHTPLIRLVGKKNLIRSHYIHQLQDTNKWVEYLIKELNKVPFRITLFKQSSNDNILNIDDTHAYSDQSSEESHAPQAASLTTI